MRRFRNYYTTILGAIVMFSSIIAFYLKMVGVMEFITLLAVGYIFLRAKDSLIEGLFFNLFKIKKEE